MRIRIAWRMCFEKVYVMAYIEPGRVISPKSHWHLFDVVLDRKEGEGAYALGTWDGERMVGFRWNGTGAAPIGNPQSRGLPTWTMLDPALYGAVVALLAPEKQVLAKRFLDLRTPAEWQAIRASAREFHLGRVANIASETPTVPVIDAPMLVLHVIPFSAVDTRQTVVPVDLLKRPELFPPLGRSRPLDYKIDHDGLLTGSHSSGLSVPQPAYVKVYRTGIVEAVASMEATGYDHNFLVLPQIQALIMKFAQHYSASLITCGVSPPLVIVVSMLGVSGMHLVQNFTANMILEDMPCGDLKDNILTFSDVIFEMVPAEANESGKALRPLLDHIANAAGLATSPYFDADANYTLRL